jgi:hypothetical protein
MALHVEGAMGNCFGLLVGCLVLFGGILDCNAQSQSWSEEQQVADLKSAFLTDGNDHLHQTKEPWDSGPYYDVAIENVCKGEAFLRAAEWVNKRYLRNRLVLIKVFGEEVVPGSTDNANDEQQKMDQLGKTIVEQSNAHDATPHCEDFWYWGAQSGKNVKVTLKIKVVDQFDERARTAALAAPGGAGVGSAFGPVGVAGGFLGGAFFGYLITNSVSQTDLETKRGPEPTTHIIIGPTGEIHPGRSVTYVTEASLIGNKKKEWIKVSLKSRPK